MINGIFGEQATTILNIHICMPKGMVYCRKCGIKNDDNAKYCIKCGVNLESSFEKRIEEAGEACFGEQMEKECFGLPNSGTIIGLIFGVFIIIIGIGVLFDWRLNIGGYVVTILGLLILIVSIYRMKQESD